MENYRRKNKGVLPKNLGRLNKQDEPIVEQTPLNHDIEKKGFISDEYSSSDESSEDEQYDEILIEDQQSEIRTLSQQVAELKTILASNNTDRKQTKRPNKRVVKKYYIQRGGDEKNNRALKDNIKHKILNF
jgi:hypothetical protein